VTGWTTLVLAGAETPELVGGVRVWATGTVRGVGVWAGFAGFTVRVTGVTWAVGVVRAGREELVPGVGRLPVAVRVGEVIWAAAWA